MKDQELISLVTADWGDGWGMPRASRSGRQRVRALWPGKGGVLGCQFERGPEWKKMWVGVVRMWGFRFRGSLSWFCCCWEVFVLRGILGVGVDVVVVV